ncbi:multidrug effflux MFS transporter [Aquimarina sp. U1-2]|uniref:multidrug effflux MFS transporter n=1 Tax=Aquimarina sp. U1-2 TaxID=2823141 RepID=UPI001AEC9C8B|nr:multidrug effflux MFS transporter [Aquimarina sp. U1-2]MBP2831922.1 multidrug effflux MFS transporter [Aquimarina sp. U1-2]
MQENKFAQFEFIGLMASLMSIVALAIDALLPALDTIGISIGTTQVADNQLLITMIFLGLGIGPLLFGPLSDHIGRKPVVYIGFLIFILASLICVFAESVVMMVAGRILQGIGLSAPRTMAIAMIRDKYSGDYMARIMSFVTVVFILVPIIAPALGKAVLDHFHWKAIFYVQLMISIIVSFWFWKRQPETLSKSKRIALNTTIFSNGLKEMSRHKTTVGYTLISGFIVGSFMVYLSTSQQIFEQQYQLKEEFPYIFGLLAFAIGSAIFLNGTLVLKLGMEKLITTSLFAYFTISLLYIILFHNGQNPNIVILLLFFAMQFFAIGFMFGNLRAMAMEPIGHIAGIGAAITGFISTLMAVPISTFIGRFVVDTTLPLFVGFLICATLSLLILGYLRLPIKK